MQTVRFLPIRARRPASLAPIYLAILCLVSLSTIGFAVASWPQDPGVSPRAQDVAETLPASQPLGDVRPFPIDERKTRHWGKWT